MATGFLVVGEPATYATTAEAAWRNAVIAGVVGRVPEDATCVSIAFSLSSVTRHWQRFDLDNLCAPVFSGLTRAGWFKGRRPNIQWWQASKRLASPAGVEIRPSSVPSPPAIEGESFKAVYSGVLPKSGSDQVFAGWVRSNLAGLDFSDTELKLGVSLRFGSSKENIAEIATGSVKKIIDCLYPLIGGVASKPHDWKVEAHYVEKGCPDVEPQAVKVSVWALPNRV